MFSKISRYRKLPDEVAVDAQGRRLPSKTIRELPEVNGAFQHVVEAGDRLDHLAYKYYKQPRKWWRICDVNPDFLSPQALLGKEPIVTARFPLATVGDVEPPWAELLATLHRTVGVEDVKVSDEIRLVAENRAINGERVEVILEHHERAVMVTYNHKNISKEGLLELISGIGSNIQKATPETMGRVGKKIVIPPDVIG